MKEEKTILLIIIFACILLFFLPIGSYKVTTAESACMITRNNVTFYGNPISSITWKIYSYKVIITNRTAEGCNLEGIDQEILKQSWEKNFGKYPYERQNLFFEDCGIGLIGIAIIFLVISFKSKNRYKSLYLFFAGMSLISFLIIPPIVLASITIGWLLNLGIDILLGGYLSIFLSIIIFYIAYKNKKTKKSRK